MRMDQVELPSNVLKIGLKGSLDIAGAGEIEMPFSVIAASRKKVIVELSQVTFLASIGIRVLVKAARTIAKNLLTAKAGGHGIALIRNRATRIDYDRVGTTNRLSITCSRAETGRQDR